MGNCGLRCGPDVAAGGLHRTRRLKIGINGRFLCQPLTGVQRYAAEMVKAMDRLLDCGHAPSTLLDAEWKLFVPPHAADVFDLRRIGIRCTGRRSGHAWDQLDLARASADGRLISLANSGPAFHRDQIVVIHDAQVFRRPDFFSWPYLVVHRTLDRLLARKATIATVSEFSRRELAAVLGLFPAEIPVFPNSAEHFSGVVPNFTVLSRFNLAPYQFFLSVGSMTKNKNVALAVKAAQLLKRPDVPLIVVGGNNGRVFQSSRTEVEPGVIKAGRLTDGEIAALYARAAAFIFPSLYEGFGVPPLEAMMFGCPVIASRADAIRETCGEAAIYFNPLDAHELSHRMAERIAAGRISERERSKQRERLAEFSWSKSALALLEFLDQSGEYQSTHVRSQLAKISSWVLTESKVSNAR
jgi:glycosyltransferase involved in cell wall biosynthesis